LDLLKRQRNAPKKRSDGQQIFEMDVDLSEVNIFELEKRQATYKSSRLEIFPTTTGTPIKDVSLPLEFKISPSPDYTDTQIFLRMIIDVTKADGTRVLRQVKEDVEQPDGTKKTVTKDVKATIYTIAHFLMTQFKMAEVFLNNTLIEPPHPHMSYVTYMNALIGYSKALDKTMLASTLSSLDSAGLHDEFDYNLGMKARALSPDDNLPMELYGQLLLEPLLQYRLLPDNVEIVIRLTRTAPQFCLLTDKLADSEAMQVSVQKANLIVRRCTLSERIINQISRQLLTTPAKYMYNHADVKTYTYPSGIQNMEREIFDGELPRKVTLFMVNQRNFSGSYKLNPFKLDHCNANYVALEINGTIIPVKGIHCNFNKDQFAFSYMYTMNANGFSTNDCNLCVPNIALDEYPLGYTFWTWDLTPDQNANGQHISEPVFGVARIVIQCESASVEPVVAVVIGEYTKAFFIKGEDRKVYV